MKREPAITIDLPMTREKNGNGGGAVPKTSVAAIQDRPGISNRSISINQTICSFRGPTIWLWSDRSILHLDSELSNNIFVSSWPAFLDLRHGMECNDNYYFVSFQEVLDEVIALSTYTRPSFVPFTWWLNSGHEEAARINCVKSTGT